MLDRLRSWLRRRGDDGDVWDLVPARQYGGRLVEGGGNTRAEQEDAIENVAERADAIEAAAEGAGTLDEVDGR